MQGDEPIRVAVVTGCHPFDVRAFTRLFRELPRIDAYIQHLDDFVADVGRARDWYQAVVFYHFHQELPDDTAQNPWWRRGVRASLERLGTTEQGIVVLHHGLVAYRGWPFWSEVVGIKERGTGFTPAQEIQVQVVDSQHPITAGVRDWRMVDEVYTIGEPDRASHVLLATDHPASMRALAWVRHFGRARVFCYQSGHGDPAFSSPGFRQVLLNGIAWVAHVI